jgi:guanylate kinase
MSKKKLIAICGKSAAGKDTMLKYMLDQAGDKANEIVSYTTRPPREGEIDGKNYHFVSDYVFTIKEMKHEMLEVASYREWRYGTAIDSLVDDKINIGVFNRKGIESLKLHDDEIDLFIVYMVASDK